MKRSEAIEELQQIIYENTSGSYDLYVNDFTSICSKILADIELRIGMTPPLTFTDPFYENAWEEE